MLSSDRQSRIFLLLLLGLGVLVSGCSSQINASRDPAITNAMADIRLQLDNSRYSQQFRIAYTRLAGTITPPAPRYQLSVKISSAAQSAVSISNISGTLKRIDMRAELELYDLTTGEVDFKTSITASATQGSASSLFSTAEAESQAYSRLITSLAERSYRRLMLHFIRQNKTASPAPS